MTHTIPEYLRQRTIRVVVIGCGGNGSVIAMGLPYIHQELLLRGHPGGLDVTLIDGELVSHSNCVRQPFSRAEIGLSKAAVLVSRINLFWELQWKAISENVAQSHKIEEADIVISCVDTRAARWEISGLITGGHATVSYWLDLGNGVDGGQFVLGQPRNHRNPARAVRLRTASELFPEINDTRLDEDDAPSCSALEALERQAPFLNQTLASSALALLAQLFRSGTSDVHGAFVSIRHQRTHPLDVDSTAWLTVRRRANTRQRLRHSIET